MKDITDDILMKAREGDVAAFEVIYRATAGFVYNVAYRIVRNAADAEEITQEVFLKAYHKLKNFRMESSLKTWLYRITVNNAINYSKKAARQREKTEEYYGTVNPWLAVDESQRSGHRHKEVVEMILKILNPDQRLCVVLRNIEGLSYAQIADVLKININTVRTRLARAREKLLTMKKEVMRNVL